VNGSNPFEPPEIEELELEDEPYQLTFFDKAMSIVMCLMIGLVLSPISYTFCMVAVTSFTWNNFESATGNFYNFIHVIIGGIHIFMGLYFLPSRLYRYVTKWKDPWSVVDKCSK